MPGNASLDKDQYYAHPRNAFWPIMGELLAQEADVWLGMAYEERCTALQHAGIAVWDVMRHCERHGSLDSAIKPNSVIANDILSLLDASSSLLTIACNGAAAHRALKKHVLPTIPEPRLQMLNILSLPSTSPAHASMSLIDKAKHWSVLNNHLSRYTL